MIWGNIPTLLGAIAYSWDGATDPHDSIGTVQKVFTLANGLVLFFFWFWYFFISGGFYTSRIFMLYQFYAPYNNENMYQSYVLQGKLEKGFEDKYPELILGFSSDVLGTIFPGKGMIPVQFIPWSYIICRVMFTFSISLCIYNDFDQALAVFFICGVLPVLLTLASESQSHFIAYETLCWFWFYTLSYLNQGAFYYDNEQGSINKNLITLQQSAAMNLSTPTDDYMGTSYRLVYATSFAVSVFALLSLFMETPPRREGGLKTA